MANALKGKTLTTLTVILPNEEVAAEMMDNIEGHLEFMQEKSYRDGPLKLIQYFISSGPEWKESSSFLDGKIPEITGRVVVTLVEIYETDDGLHHHWVESRETYPDFEAWIREVGGEIQLHSFQKIIQSLWD